MTSEEKQKKFDEVVKVLKEAYEDGSLNEIIDIVFDMVMGDIFKDYPTDHLGTFAEFKHIDEFGTPSLPDDIINRSTCAWSTCDIQEAIRRAKDADKSRNKKKVR